jgi:predicted O-methyltransferase YrrM
LIQWKGTPVTDGGSSIPEVQALLRVLASGRKAAEAGTAFGEGARAIGETALSLVTVELDPNRAAVAKEALADRGNVEVVVGDWRQELPARAPFEFLFVDSTFKHDPPKEGALAVDLLADGGLLLVDDMTPGWKGHDPARSFLFGNPELQTVEVLTTTNTSALIAVKHVR